MRHSPSTLVLFCAGKGTRMRPLTATLPKPMIEVAGRPLVDHALQLFPSRFKCIANTHYLADKIEPHLSSAGIETVYEQELLETGGGLKNILGKHPIEAVFTSNTDAAWDENSVASTLLQAWNPDKMDALLLTVPSARAHGHSGSGDFTLHQNGKLSRGGDHIYTGVQIIKAAPVLEVEDSVFSLNVVWTQIAHKGRLFGVEYSGNWCDVGQPQSIEVAEKMLRDQHV